MKKKAAVFGTGEIYQAIKNTIFKKYNITSIFDNDKRKWEKPIDGLKILPANKLIASKFEAIIIASTHSKSIAKQIMNLGVNSKKIKLGANFLFNQKKNLK